MAVISELCCPKCEYQSPSKTVFQCPNCKSILEVNVEISHLTRSDFDTMRRSRDRTIWRWFDFFPIEKRSSIVSLGEGCTPLIHSKRLGEHLGISPFLFEERHRLADWLAEGPKQQRWALGCQGARLYDRHGDVDW